MNTLEKLDKIKGGFFDKEKISELGGNVPPDNKSVYAFFRACERPGHTSLESMRKMLELREAVRPGADIDQFTESDWNKVIDLIKQG